MLSFQSDTMVNDDGVCAVVLRCECVAEGLEISIFDYLCKWSLIRPIPIL